MGMRVSVEFDVELPAEATDEQVDEWLRYAFGERASMSGDNPLSEYDGEAVFGTLRYR